MSLDVESILTGLRNARREAIMSWEDGEKAADEANHLLNAILDVELAIAALEQHAEEATEPRETDEIRGMVSALASKARPQ